MISLESSLSSRKFTRLNKKREAAKDMSINKFSLGECNIWPRQSLNMVTSKPQEVKLESSATLSNTSAISNRVVKSHSLPLILSAPMSSSSNTRLLSLIVTLQAILAIMNTKFRTLIELVTQK